MDAHLARLAYHSIAPHLPKGSTVSADDYRFIKTQKQEDEDAKQYREEALQQHHLMLMRAKARAREYGKRKN